MTTATASTTSPAGPLVLADPAGTVRLARWTGAAYLALGVTGVVGILALAPQLTAADPAATLAALRANDALARAVIAMELGVVISQALAAVWFWRLFSALGRTADGVAVLAFGLVNAVAILGSVAARAVALAVAADPALAPGADAAAAVALAQEASTQLWAVGAVFFGLWLIPMGHAARTSGRMPAVLGWLLVGGGAGYVLSAFVDLGVAGAPAWLVDGLTLPATVGEFWMIGYLLAVGVRRTGAR